jgi:serine/threonine kinase 16
MLTSIWHCVIQLTRWLLGLVKEIWRKTTARPIHFDSGRSVRAGKQIAEGGFSFVFEATDSTGAKYALKRVHVGDPDALQHCLREAGVHRSLQHPHLMPILGVCQEQFMVYMLFPYVPQSLRSVVNKAIFESKPPRKPFTEMRVLQMFHQILSGVSAMHDAGYSHRDIKLENVLLDDRGNPILMDFGSVGKLEEPISTRKQVLSLADTAAQHTTLPYRPPELLEGGVRSGDHPIDYGKVDVWSLGCTLFAMCYGASPFECEFRGGDIRIVDCTQLRILGSLPKPPADWYSSALFEAIQLMLTQDRHKRPTLDEAMAETETMIQKMGGRIPKTTKKGGDDDDTDLDALLRSNRFV